MLLRDVSRSFYLSVRLLPRPMREPVAVGYLLARASDTVADTPGMTPAEREARLRELADAYEGHAPLPRGYADALAPLQASPGESHLLRVLPACIAWLESLPAADRQDVRAVLQPIVRGQVLDVQRFGSASPHAPQALQTAAELDEYTWLVAGCVGEFWTRVAIRHSKGFSDLPDEAAMGLARGYGEALQLVNILRDRDADRAIGRDYLPREAPEPARWLARARAGLDGGVRYASAIRPLRLRVASALPALLGVRTLALARDTSGAKMPRAEVRAMLWRIALGGATAAAIRREYERQARGAPEAGWDNRAP